MKIIFLDIDGVLNSLSYHKRVGFEQSLIDPSAVERLKKLVDATGAGLVLSSSWRHGWNSNEKLCGDEGHILNKALGEAGLQIMDKTGEDESSFSRTRCREILKWLKKAPEHVESFVILDDGEYAWEQYGLDRFWVRTDFLDEGFKECHLSKAEAILKKPPMSVRRLLILNLFKGGIYVR